MTKCLYHDRPGPEVTNNDPLVSNQDKNIWKSLSQFIDRVAIAIYIILEILFFFLYVPR